LPSLWLLFHVFRSGHPTDVVQEKEAGPAR
jgi:hypothetical protein